MAKVKIAERIVKPLGIVYLFNTIYHVDPKLEGEKIELWETVRGLEIRKENKTYHLLEQYWEKKR